MIIVEKILEMRGMRRSEIINYFAGLNGEDKGDGKFAGLNWEVEVKEENLAAIGRLKLPSTKVLFRSDEEHIEQIIYAFKLRFLSAGG
jgi:hypothetical protein